LISVYQSLGRVSLIMVIVLVVLLYTVGHKKRATLFWATTSMFLYEF